MSHIIKRFSYFKNLILTILVATVVSFPLAKAEPVAEIASVIGALNRLMSEGVNNTSLNLQPLFDGVAMKSGNSNGELAPTPFIIGGTTAPRSLYREYTLVVITNRIGDIIGLCGGTMIASNKVLTAAHCSQESAGQYFIIPGFYAFSDQLRESDIFPVRRVAVHPGYNDVTSANDAAILTLTRNYFTKIVPVLSGTNKLTGNNGVVIGIGLTSTNPQTNPNALQEVSAPITSNSSCNNQWESFAGISPIQPNMICAGFTTDARGSCSGDSGSALFVQINGQRVIAGTVSFGFGQCELNRATQAYARMTSMTDFIRSESPSTIFIESNQRSIAPITTFLLSDAGGDGSVDEPATFNYPSLPAPHKFRN
jgi:secreted trypsin-like serine protease